MKVYYSYTENWSERELAQAWEALPPLRRERMDRYRRREDQRESAAAALLAAWAFQQEERDQADIPPGPVEILPDSLLAEETARFSHALNWTPGPAGKPFERGLLTSGGRRYLSLSHTGGAVAAAVADAPVGADIERLDKLSPETSRALLRRFHPVERELLEGLADEELAVRLAVWWTLKESVMKLTGQGLRLPLNQFCILPAGEAVSESGTAEYFTGSRQSAEWRLCSWPLPPFQLSAAVAEKTGGSTAFDRD